MSHLIHQGRILRIYSEDVTLPTGVAVKHDVIRHPGASAIVPLDGRDVILIRQYRYCASGYLWEVPAGTLNAGETPEQCAKRELIEEAGVDAGELHHAGFIFTAPGFTDEKIHIFVARKLTPRPQNLDDDEVITEVKRVPFDECIAMVARGEIVDAKTIAGLLHAQRYLA